MSNFSELQQRFNEAEAKVNELRKQLDVERNNERAQGIVAARELIKIHGLTARRKASLPVFQYRVSLSS